MCNAALEPHCHHRVDRMGTPINDKSADKRSSKPVRSMQRLDPPHHPTDETRSPIMENKATANAGIGTESTAGSQAAFGESNNEIKLAQVVEAEISLQRRLRQASELATHLRTRQDELDRREAELNARSAAIEHEERMTRMWIEETAIAINDEKVAIVEADEAFKVECESVEQKQQEAARDLAVREQALTERLEQFDREKAAFAQITRQVQWEHDAALQRARQVEARANEREAALEDERIAVKLEYAKADRIRFQLEHELRIARNESTEMLRSRQRIRDLESEREAYALWQKENFERDQEALRIESRKREQELNERSRRIGERQQNVANNHRELIEEQIGLQQLWSKVCPASEREGATKRIGFLRLQLKELFSKEIRQLQESHAENDRRLEAIRMAEINLERQKTKLADWLLQQREGFALQLARLNSEAQRLRCWEAKLESQQIQGIIAVACDERKK